MNNPLIKTNDISARQSAIALAAIFAVGLALRIAITFSQPMGLNFFSDDNAYISSAIDFIKTGYITYSDHLRQSGVLGVGMPLILGLLFSVFGYQPAGLLASHVVFSCIGLLTAYGAYLWGRALHSRRAGVLAAALVTFDCCMMISNCSFYTETPYMCACLYALYFLSACVRRWNPWQFAAGIACFCAAASLKGLACLAPACVLALVWMYRVPLRRWLPKALIVIVVSALVFLPWCVRNLSVTGSFVPFPISQGDQKLLGSFEGIGCPEGDYASATLELDRRAWEEGYMADSIQRLKESGKYADMRYSKWFREQPLGFLFTHLVYKPLKLITSITINRSIIPIPGKLLQAAWYACLALSLAGFVLGRKTRLSWMPLIYLTAAVYITSVYIPLGRYNLPHIPFVLIYTSIGVFELYGRLTAIRRRRRASTAQA